jgi:acyl-CoA synthetase (AMP-forming)/AMP-acid ligase II
VGVTLRWEEDVALPPDVRAGLTGPGAPFELVEEAVLGVHLRVFRRRPRSVREILLSAAETRGDSPFLVFPERTYTYSDFVAAVGSAAACLSERFGVGSGDRVAIASRNSAAHAVGAWAVICLGGVVAELNAWWAGAELADAVTRCGPSLVLADQARVERAGWESSAPQGGRPPVVDLDASFGEIESYRPGSALPDMVIDEDDPLVILFTSGTTGRPKGAVLSHRGHIHMMMQAVLQGLVSSAQSEAGHPHPGSDAGHPHPGSAAAAAPGPAAAGGGGGGSTVIGVSPMFHISGFTTQLIGGPLMGVTVAYPPPGRWTPEVHLEMTERHRASAWSLVPAQLWRLLESPALASTDLSSLQRVGGGGATFAPELWRQVRLRIPQVSRMGTGYGMSETCGAGTHHDGEAAVLHPDAVGAPCPGTEIQVRGANGDVLDEGEVGVIHLRGPTTMLGYWGDPEATSAALDAGRWYCTGELGHISDGLLYLDSRGPDLIVRGGENVYPVEIENRLVEHPDVLEAAVIGVEDRIMGQRVVAHIVVRPGASPEPESLRDWVAQGLAGFKVPEAVFTHDDLPHNAAGKIVKSELTAMPVAPGCGRPATSDQEG